MKHPSFINLWHAVVAAVALAFLPAGHAEDAPRIDALRVAKMAAEYLATRGKDAPYVVSIVLEKDALIHGKNSWLVRWSRPIPLDDDKEIGMRVRLDGSVTHIVEDKAGPKKHRAPMKT
jgi:hypothetical protein